MKVSQLRRLRSHAKLMASASSADAVEWYGRTIAGVIAEIDAAPEASPDMGHHCHSPGAVAIAQQHHHHEATDGPSAASSPADGSASPIEPPAPAVAAVPAARKRIPRGERAVNRQTHPLFADDPIARDDFSGPRYGRIVL